MRLGRREIVNLAAACTMVAGLLSAAPITFAGELTNTADEITLAATTSTTVAATDPPPSDDGIEGGEGVGDGGGGDTPIDD